MAWDAPRQPKPRAPRYGLEPFDKDAALARIAAAEQRKSDRVHREKTGRRQHRKQARNQRRQKRG